MSKTEKTKEEDTPKKRRRSRRKRRHKEVEEDFIFEDEVPSETCKVCGAVTIFSEERLCPACMAATKLTDIVQDKIKAKDVMGAVLGAVGSVVLQAGRPTIQRFVTNVLNAQQNTGKGFSSQQQAPPPHRAQRKPEIDPWPILGLDPNKATIDDVKKMQRRLADIYHPDKAEGAVNAEALARINAAADAAIKRLKK